MFLGEVRAPQAGLVPTRGSGGALLLPRRPAPARPPPTTSAPSKLWAVHGALFVPWFTLVENGDEDTYLLELP